MKPTPACALLNGRVALACAGLESGAAPILEQVTPVTADLLHWWFQQDCCDARAVNFHAGQRQASVCECEEVGCKVTGGGGIAITNWQRIKEIEDEADPEEGESFNLSLRVPLCLGFHATDSELIPPMKKISSKLPSWLRGFNRLVLFTSFLLFASQSFAQPYATVSTFAGGPFNDGPAAAARFFLPRDVAVAADGTTYVADNGNFRIRKIFPDGSVTTFVGSGVAGFADGPGEYAKFLSPTGITIGPTGDFYVADALNNRIRKITPAGVVSTLAGSGVAGFADGPGATAQFKSPLRLTTGPDGTVYVADTDNNRIRK
ncbi:MAG: hypothetical protein RIQ79_881, partial [Verrucomicrobiota bacterium]